MDCDRIRSFLDEFAEGELKASHRQMVEGHLKTCPLCRKELSAIRRTISLLAEFGEVDVPPDFVQEVRARIEARQRRSVLSRLLPRPAVARVLAPVGCVMLVALAGWVAYRQLWPPQEEIVSYRGEKGDKPTEIALAHDYREELPPESREKLGALPRKRLRDGDIDTMAPAVTEKDDYSLEGTELAFSRTPAARVENGARGSSVRLNVRGIERKTDLGLPDAISGKPKAVGFEVKMKGERATASPAVPYGAEKELEEAVKGPSADMRLARGARKGLETAAVTRSVASRKMGETKEALFAGETSSKDAAGVGGESAERFSMLGKPAEETAAGVEKRLNAAWLAKKPGEELARLGTELQSEEPSAGRKEETASLEELAFYYGDFNGVLVLPDEEGLKKQTEFYFVPRGGASLHGTLRARGKDGRGPIPVHVLRVKDREKTLAEIKRAVAKLGGTIEFPTEQKRRASGSGVSEPNTLLIQLKGTAFPSFREKYLVRSRSRELLAAESELRQSDELKQAQPEQQDTILLLIRIVEVTEQEQSQQPPAKEVP